MKAVCIGIHIHAEPERLQATLNSLQANTERPFELLILPDGPDETTRIWLAERPELLQVGTGEPLGPPACFNRLVTISAAEVLVLLESGAQVGPGWFNYLLKALAADPCNGLAGPTTNLAWNEQNQFPYAGSSPAEIAQTAQQAAALFGADVRTLEPLYSLGDFCYAVKREVVEAIGGADEAYTTGPCWEMDYNIRAARAGFRAVWACGAYVHRAPFTARRRQEEDRRFEASRKRYQDKFCGLHLRGEQSWYEPHCRGEACPHFAPTNLIQLQIPLRKKEPETEAQKTATTAETVVSPPAVPTLSARTFPLVSCIMPTAGRPDYVRKAIEYFQRQDYPNLELIILDDASNAPPALPEDSRIRYFQTAPGLSIGNKRNRACEMAHGEIIAHWDDDDWYASDRLSVQVAPILAGEADICGLKAGIFFDLSRWEFWRCKPDLHAGLFVEDVHGGTLVFRREIWERLARYPDVSLAEDAFFLANAVRLGARLCRLPNNGEFVYLRHSANSWSFPLGQYLDPRGWEQVSEPNLPAADRNFYTAFSPAAPKVTANFNALDTGKSVGRGDPAPTDDHHPAGRGDPAPTDNYQLLEPSFISNLPLVSCIMPTCNRRAFIPLAIRYFQSQDYLNKELLILDDGSDPVSDLVPADDPQIRYIQLENRLILGAKRNNACELAIGSIIVHWDDDDWFAPNRLSYQIQALEKAQADLCGTNCQYYYEPSTSRSWLYEYPSALRRWIAGNSLCYRKEFWRKNPFPETQIGEDTAFVWSPLAEKMLVLPDYNFCVGLVHPGNTSQKNTDDIYWQPYSTPEIEELLGPDLAAYRSLYFL